MDSPARLPAAGRLAFAVGGWCEPAPPWTSQARQPVLGLRRVQLWSSSGSSVPLWRPAPFRLLHTLGSPLHSTLSSRVCELLSSYPFSFLQLPEQKGIEPFVRPPGPALGGGGTPTPLCIKGLALPAEDMQSAEMAWQGTLSFGTVCGAKGWAAIQRSREAGSTPFLAALSR